MNKSGTLNHSFDISPAEKAIQTFLTSVTKDILAMEKIVNEKVAMDEPSQKIFDNCLTLLDNRDWNISTATEAEILERLMNSKLALMTAAMSISLNKTSQVNIKKKNEKEIKSEQGKSNAQKKAANSLQGIAKVKAKKYWDAWQKKPSIYESKAQFARDMLEKFTDLTDVKTVEKWCRQWEKL